MMATTVAEWARSHITSFSQLNGLTNDVKEKNLDVKIVESGWYSVGDIRKYCKEGDIISCNKKPVKEDEYKCVCGREFMMETGGHKERKYVCSHCEQTFKHYDLIEYTGSYSSPYERQSAPPIEYTIYRCKECHDKVENACKSLDKHIEESKQ